MRVPADVPPNVPVADEPATAPTGVAADVIAEVTADAPTRRGRADKTRKRNDGTVAHLTGGTGGWRFQMRIPAVLLGDDSRVAGGGSTIRASIGPRGRGEARRLARQLATLCESIFALAAAKKETDTMTTPQSPDDNGNKLVEQVIDACQQAIKTAVAQPSRAIGLAQGLGSALTALQLVQTEVGKGQHGARAVIDHADDLARGALKDVLAHAADPKRALDILDTTLDIVPSGTLAPNETAATPAPPSPPASGGHLLPTFSELADAYIAMRIANDGEGHPQIPSLRLYKRSFVDVVGNRRANEYFGSDMQAFVSKMQFWPANASKRAEFVGKSTLEIIEANKNLALPPLSRKTLSDGYVAFIRTMMRFGMNDYAYRDPFAGVQIRWPQLQQAPVPREGISLDVLDRVFSTGVASGYLDEALLPLLSALTSRRLGMGVYLCGVDIREKHGVMVAQTSGVVLENGRWRRIPIKSDESAGFYVLHNFLSEIGFVDWARKQDWVFAAAHEHPDPAKYESKVMNRLLKDCGAAGGEVFHSLRGDAIDAMRGADVQGRAVRLQAGHELGDVHERYGHRALSAENCKRLASMPLPAGIDWSVFDDLDFDALAARRRGPGRRRR